MRQYETCAKHRERESTSLSKIPYVSLEKFRINLNLPESKTC